MPRITDAAKRKSRLTKEEWREYTKTVWRIANVSHDEHPAVFPAEIPRRLIKLFSWHGETVLDPFAGTGTTAEAGVPLGRKVICVDQSRKYTNIIRRSHNGTGDGHGPAMRLLDVVNGDSRDLSFIDDGAVSLVVSSPPYWNKARYDGTRMDLGKVAGYRNFLREIRPVFEECFRVLQPNRKCCLVTANVNQHTDHGLLTFPLAADFGAILREIGFVMVTEIVWSKDGTGGRWGSANGQRPIFGSYPYPPNFLFKNVHEYILVFSKPASKKTNGPKALPYHELMAESSNGRRKGRAAGNGP